MTNKNKYFLYSFGFGLLLAAIHPCLAQAQPTQSKTFAGVWNATANSDQGEGKSTWTIKQTADLNYSGKYTSTNSEREMTNIRTEGDSLNFEMDVEAQGQSVLVKVESVVDGQHLKGNWKAFVDGNEVATGSLVAIKQLGLSDFRGYTSDKVGSGWSMTDGTLHFDGTKSGDITTKNEFANFILEFDWKISEAGNSGVMYRVSLGDKKPYKSGPEYQVLDDDKHKDGKLESHRAGALYALYIPKNKTLKPVGQWNSSKIVLKGGSVEHWLNGKKVVEAELGSADWNQKVGASKFNGWEKFGKNKKGHICFQDHGDPVWYRNIRIRTID